MNYILFRTLAITSLLWAFQSVQAADNQTFVWPNGAKAAVNLGYDDALDSQLDNAIPALNRYGFHGTFYLTLASDVVAKRMPEWRAAAAQGHELANHTLFHQCSRSQPGRDWVPEHRDLDKISVAQLKDQIVLGNVMLTAIDGQTERTFTTPCIDLKAGGENYINAIKSEFVAIKSAIGGVIDNMNQLDPYAVSVNLPSDVSGQELITVVKQAAQKGTMASFTFHGIGGDHLSVSKEAHEELLQYLAQHPETYWVESFINVMKYVKENR